jgi:DNA-binding IclR family transcriptional regulator
VMEVLSERGETGLTQIARETGLTKSTAHRFLQSLISMGYAAQNQDNGKYALTLKILKIAGGVLDRLSVPSIARPYMESLGEQVEETVHLVRREGENIVYVDKIEAGTGSIRMVSSIGKTMPLYCTAVGKAILATLSQEERAGIWENSRIVKYTEKTIVTLAALEAQIQEIQRRGYAVDDEENELGVRCVAAAIRGAGGRAEYAMSVSAPVPRLPYSRIGQIARGLTDAGRQIERNIRYLR